MGKAMSIEEIRQRTKQTHDEVYSREVLFDENSPSFIRTTEPFALEAVDKYLMDKQDVRVLDLGSGVGRIAIPIAQRIQDSGGRIVCVDIIDTAITKLNEYVEQYGLRESIEGIVSSAEDYTIEPESFDCIITFGVLAHLLSRKHIEQTLQKMKAGTKPGGINIIGLMTEPTDVFLDTHTEQPSTVEVYLSLEEGESLLRNQYADWEILSLERNPYEETSKRNPMKMWKTNLLNLLARRAT